MNLPIIQSIFHGALRPNLILWETRIDGKLVLKPEDNLPYQELLRSLSNIPTNLEDIEKLCLLTFGEYAQFDFSSEKPYCIANIAPDEFTPISTYHFVANIQLDQPTTTTPYLKFYEAIIKLESARLKLALLNFSDVSKSDIDTRGTVKDTLKQIYSYSKEAINRGYDVTLYSTEPLHEITELNLEKIKNDNSVFLILKTYLIKLYFEIVLMFQSILTENDYISFDDYIYKCYGDYPTAEQSNAYQAAELIQQAQKAIALQQAEPENILLLAQLYKSVETNPAAETLKIVTAALENFVFLQHTKQPKPAFEQLLNDNYTKSILRDAKADINEQILSLTNPREVQLKLDEIKDEQPVLPSCNLHFESIPRKLNEWLQKQYKICEDNIAQSFIPVATTNKTSGNIKAKRQKSNTSQLKTKAHKRLDFLSGYNLRDEKIMSDNDFINLLDYVDDFLENGQIPQDISAIHTNISIEYLRYTFYLIYKDLSLKNPTRAEWVDLLHAVFSQFENTEKPTTNKKFSTKPNLYDNDTKTIIKNKR